MRRRDEETRDFLSFIREQRALLEKCARTTLSSKLIARQRDFFAKMVVDTVLMLGELLPLNMYVEKMN